MVVGRVWRALGRRNVTQRDAGWLRNGQRTCRYVVFFFSSRRRHTRLQGDWSSDVCSSDLWLAEKLITESCEVESGHESGSTFRQLGAGDSNGCDSEQHLRFWSWSRRAEIGRASCRERV